MKLSLTPQQITDLSGLLAMANAALSPHCLIGEIRRTNWTEGAELVLHVSAIDRPMVEIMRAAYQKELARRIQRKAKAQAIIEREKGAKTA